MQNLSIGVNVVHEGSHSRMGRVLLISLGITIRPRSSTRLTIPVAVPDIFVGLERPSSSVDRGHSLRSLLPPQAALPSLPSCFHSISFSFSVHPWPPALVREVAARKGRRRERTPPVTCGDSPLLKAGAKAAPTIILQLALRVCKQMTLALIPGGRLSEALLEHLGKGIDIGISH